MAKQRTAQDEELLGARTKDVAAQEQLRAMQLQQIKNTLTTTAARDAVARQNGYADFESWKEAETAREKAATNDRLIASSSKSAKISALKDMATTAAAIPGGEKHAQAALNALAKEAGVTIPADQPTPHQQAMDKVRATKGLPPLYPTTTTPATPTEPTQPTPTPGSASLIQPAANISSLVQAATPNVPDNQDVVPHTITPHLGTGGAEITPENPTGNLDNPWAAGGLFDNPTHAAALAQQVQQARQFPTGPDSRVGTHFDYLSAPTSPVASPMNLVKANNVPPGPETARPVGTVAASIPGNTLPPSPAPVANPVGYNPPAVSAAPAPTGAPAIDNSPFSLQNAGLGWLQNLINTGRTATPNPDDRRAKLAALGLSRAY